MPLPDRLRFAPLVLVLALTFGALLYQPIRILFHRSESPPSCWTQEEVRAYEQRLGGSQITFTQLDITNHDRCRFRIVMTYTAPWSSSPIHDELNVDFIHGYSPLPRQQLIPIPPPQEPQR